MLHDPSVLASGQIEQAHEHYGRAVDADPANTEARRNLAAVLVAAHEPEAALAQFTEALHRRPE